MSLFNIPSVIRVITFWLHNKIIQEWVGSSKGLLNFVICSVRLCVSLLALGPQLSWKKERKGKKFDCSSSMLLPKKYYYQLPLSTATPPISDYLTNLMQMQMQMARCPSRLGFAQFIY